MHHVNYFWVNLGTAYIGQCISVTDITHLNRLCVTIHVLLCILKCFYCIWSFSFFGHPLRGFYKSMYIIAFLFLTSLLFYSKGYSATLKLTVHQVLLQIQQLRYMFLSIYINQKHKISFLKRNWKKAFQQISTTNFSVLCIWKDFALDDAHRILNFLGCLMFCSG